jgi:hypothetical protein
MGSRGFGGHEFFAFADGLETQQFGLVFFHRR